MFQEQLDQPESCVILVRQQMFNLFFPVIFNLPHHLAHLELILQERHTCQHCQHNPGSSLPLFLLNLTPLPLVVSTLSSCFHLSFSKFLVDSYRFSHKDKENGVSLPCLYDMCQYDTFLFRWIWLRLATLSKATQEIYWTRLGVKCIPFSHQTQPSTILFGSSQSYQCIWVLR